MKKRLFSLLACLCIFTCLCYPSHAAFALDNTEEVIAPRNEPATYYWSIAEKTDLGITTNGEPSEFYDSHTATEAGEQYYAIYTTQKSVEINGMVKVSYKLLEAELGFKIEEITVNGKIVSSRQLAKGETINVYSQPRYQKYKVTQKEIKIDQAGHSIETGKIEIIYVYKPIMPEFTFIYRQ